MKHALALICLSTVAVASEPSQQQFNLVCRGLEQLTPGGRQRQAERVYRIDLDRKVWCIEDCSVVLPIAEITDARLILQKVERYGMEIQHWIDRMTGEVSELYFTAHCERAPFTPIPNRKF